MALPREDTWTASMESTQHVMNASPSSGAVAASSPPASPLEGMMMGVVVCGWSFQVSRGGHCQFIKVFVSKQAAVLKGRRLILTVAVTPHAPGRTRSNFKSRFQSICEI